MKKVVDAFMGLAIIVAILMVVAISVQKLSRSVVMLDNDEWVCVKYNPADPKECLAYKAVQ